ncbi:MAG: elongation factor 4, partial [bacterium]|nr:elongation factor 4 [bacterium]
EIITNFYDRLKSVSSGYASLNYELIGWRVGDLVKLDILVASDPIEALSHIVPRAFAESRGRRIVERLGDLIPKQLFAVSLQAAIGGKVVARETISAMRKDVTGYLYGGDYTRKRKLLEKQKRGKKRMKASGRVEIPSQVFLEMLKE